MNGRLILALRPYRKISYPPFTLQYLAYLIVCACASAVTRKGRPTLVPEKGKQPR